MPLTAEEKKERKRAYYLLNKERILKQQKDYREKNPDAVKEWYRKYGEKHREKIAERKKKWRVDNPENDVVYRKENRDKINAKRKRYYEENKTKCDESIARSREKKPGKYSEMARLQGKKNRVLLHDGYVKQKIRRGTSLVSANIPQSLVKAKRAHMKVNRLIKEQENG